MKINNRLVVVFFFDVNRLVVVKHQSMLIIMAMIKIGQEL